jgi:hypothetical protein
VPARRPREPATAARPETRGSSDPFDSIRLEGNPYEKHLKDGQPAPRPVVPEPAQPAPPETVPAEPGAHSPRALPVQAPALRSPPQN